MGEIIYLDRGKNHSLYSYDKNTLLLIHGNEVKDYSLLQIPLSNEGVVVDSEGRFGLKSLYFDGKSRITFPSQNIIYSDQDFTFDWWEKAEEGATVRFSSYIDKNNYGGMLIGYAGNRVDAGSALSQWNIAHALSGLNIVLNEWVHRAVVRKNNTIMTFLNGKTLLKPTSFKGVIYQPVDSMQSIGSYQEGNNQRCFKGKICEFRISNIARWDKDFIPSNEPY